MNDSTAHDYVGNSSVTYECAVFAGGLPASTAPAAVGQFVHVRSPTAFGRRWPCDCNWRESITHIPKDGRARTDCTEFGRRWLCDPFPAWRDSARGGAKVYGEVTCRLCTKLKARPPPLPRQVFVGRTTQRPVPIRAANPGGPGG